MARASILFCVTLILSACGSSDTALDEGRIAENEARASSDLAYPNFRSLEPLPTAAQSIDVVIDRDGYLRIDGEPVSLDAFNDQLVRRVKNVEREHDGASPLYVVLHLDHGTCWRVVQWIMQVCVRRPQSLYRMVFAGRQDETQRIGGIRLDLPKDGRVHPHFPEEYPSTQLKFFARAGEMADASHAAAYLRFRRAVYALAIRKRKAYEATGKSWSSGLTELISPPLDEGLVRTGYVLQALDALRWAGYGGIVFEGRAFPVPAKPNDDDEKASNYLGNPRTDAHAFARYARSHEDNHVLLKFDGEYALHSKDANGPSLSKRSLMVDPHALNDEEHGPNPVDEPEVELDDPEESVAVTLDGDSVVDSSVGQAHSYRPLGRWVYPYGAFPMGAFHSREEASSSRYCKQIDNALRWLAAHQSANGGWEAANFGKWCDGKLVESVDEKAVGAGKPAYDVGVSGLALCAFLGAGYTNRGKHPYARVIGRGLRSLKKMQDAEGCFGPRRPERYRYNHAACSLAMVEAYGMTRSAIYRSSAQKSLDYIKQCRNPHAAWSYGMPPFRSDTSTTAWMVAVLHSAGRLNGYMKRRGRSEPLEIDDGALKGVRKWLDKVTDAETGRVKYRVGLSSDVRPQEKAFSPDKTEATTAIGILARIYSGEDPRKSAVIKHGTALCLKKLPRWDAKGSSVEVYYWYFATLAMYQLGGDNWGTWSVALEKALLPNQRNDTTHCEFKGSWNPIGPWGADGGRVYSTAMLAMCLQAAYRYRRVFARK